MQHTDELTQKFVAAGVFRQVSQSAVQQGLAWILGLSQVAISAALSGNFKKQVTDAVENRLPEKMRSMGHMDSKNTCQSRLLFLVFARPAVLSRALYRAGSNRNFPLEHTIVGSRPDGATAPGVSSYAIDGNAINHSTAVKDLSTVLYASPMPVHNMDTVTELLGDFMPPWASAPVLAGYLQDSSAHVSTPQAWTRAQSKGARSSVEMICVLQRADPEPLKPLAVAAPNVAGNLARGYQSVVATR